MRTQGILTSKRNECCFVSGSYCLVTLYPGLPILTAKGGKKANENNRQENTVLITSVVLYYQKVTTKQEGLIAYKKMLAVE